MAQSYYEILGVAKTATPDEIKKAYRALVQQYHPDKHPDDKDAPSKMKEINEAYAILSDAEKRKEYDYKASDTASFFNLGGTYFEHIEDLFQVFRGYKKSVVELTLLEVVQGSPGKKVTIYVPDATQTSFKRSLRPVEVSLDIPPGCYERTSLKTQVEVEGTKSEILINFKVKEDPKFQRAANGDLITNAMITFPMAVLGGTIEVDLIDGKKHKLEIPESTQSNTFFKIKEQGLPKVPWDLARGNLLVFLTIDIPKNLGEETKNLIRELQNKLA